MFQEISFYKFISVSFPVYELGENIYKWRAMPLFKDKFSEGEDSLTGFALLSNGYLSIWLLSIWLLFNLVNIVIYV